MKLSQILEANNSWKSERQRKAEEDEREMDFKWKGEGKWQKMEIKKAKRLENREETGK